MTWDNNLCEAYCCVNGSAEWPFGDEWKMALVNPIIYNLIVQMSQNVGIKKIPNNKFPYKYLQRWPEKLPKLNTEGFKKWHEEVESVPGEIKVWDLGCGEGYLGRWLAKLNVNYTGIDESKQMVSKAIKRCDSYQFAKKVKAPPTFHLANLDNNIDFKFLNKLIVKNGSPDLFVVVNLIEHLQVDSFQILDWINDQLTINNSLALFVTLNPDYFLSREDSVIVDLQKPLVQKWEHKITTTIDSADVNVDITIRLVNLIKRIFRDKKLRILQHSPLFFPGNYLPKKSKNKGISPFHYYLLSSFEYSREVVSSDAFNDILVSLIKNNHTINENDLEILKKHHKELEILRLKKGEFLIDKNNLGGDIFFVISGGLELDDGSRGPILFPKGAILGELEFGESGEEALFTYPVYSYADSSSVLRIPANVAVELLSRNSFTSSVLKQLRKRVNIKNLKTLEKTKNHKETTLGSLKPRAIIDIYTEKFKNIECLYPWASNFKSAWQVIRVLLGISEAERVFNKRDIEGRRILTTAKIIAEESESESVSTTKINNILKLLTHWRFIDTYTTLDIQKKTSHHETYYNKSIKEIYKSAAIKYFSTAPQKIIEKVINYIEISSNHNLHPGSKAKKKVFETFLSRDGAELAKDIFSIIESSINEPQKSMRLFCQFTSMASYLWSCKDNINFIIIRDMDKLRNLLTTNDTISIFEYLKTRGSELGIKNKEIPRYYYTIINSICENNMEGILITYMEDLKNFILKDLQNDKSKLVFSGLSENVLMKK